LYLSCPHHSNLESLCHHPLQRRRPYYYVLIGVPTPTANGGIRNGNGSGDNGDGDGGGDGDSTRSRVKMRSSTVVSVTRRDCMTCDGERYTLGGIDGGYRAKIEGASYAFKPDDSLAAFWLP
jgi:hypothetical protein